MTVLLLEKMLDSWYAMDRIESYYTSLGQDAVRVVMAKSWWA